MNLPADEACELGREMGRDEATEAIVRWLRTQVEEWPTHSMFWEALTRAVEGIEAGEPMTSIGRRHGITATRVMQILARAKREEGQGT